MNEDWPNEIVEGSYKLPWQGSTRPYEEHTVEVMGRTTHPEAGLICEDCQEVFEELLWLKVDKKDTVWCPSCYDYFVKEVLGWTL